MPCVSSRPLKPLLPGRLSAVGGIWPRDWMKVPALTKDVHRAMTKRTDDLKEDSTSVRNKQQQVQVGGES